jgi:hypothetical protein
MKILTGVERDKMVSAAMDFISNNLVIKVMKVNAQSVILEIVAGDQNLRVELEERSQIAIELPKEDLD